MSQSDSTGVRLDEFNPIVEALTNGSTQENDRSLSKSIRRVDKQFTLYVSNVSFTPTRVVRQFVADLRDTIKPYWTLGYFFPALRFSKTRDFRAKLYNINFSAVGDRVHCILGNADERRLFIDLLTGRKKSGIVNGDISVSGGTIKEDFYGNVCFVPGKSLYIPGLTYMEMIRYSAKLSIKNYDGESSGFDDFIEARVMDILDIMDLTACKDRKIADQPEAKGQLGCDFRRLGIAIEIASLPPVIVIDDPALSLDPSVSIQIFKCLGRLATRGHIVLCSMEKPKLQEFKMLDSVILLAGGISVFSSSRKNIEPYFCDDSVGYHLEDKQEIVQFILDIASGVERPHTQRTAEIPSYMQERFEQSNYFVYPRMPSLTVDNQFSSEAPDTAFSEKNLSYFGYLRGHGSISNKLYRLGIIIHRAFTAKIKDTQMLIKPIQGAIVLSLFLGYIQYGNAEIGTYATNLLGFPYAQTTNTQACLMFSTAFVLGVAIVQLHVIVKKVQMFRYEQNANTCGVVAFCLSNAISEFPFAVIPGMIFGIIFYYMTDMSSGAENLSFWIRMNLYTSILGVSLIYMLTILLKKEMAIREIFAATMLLFVFFSGFPFNLNNMYTFMLELSKFTPLRWIYQAQIVWKFDQYPDGSNVINTLGFENFNKDQIFRIYDHFLLAINLTIFLASLQRPNKLCRESTQQIMRASNTSMDSDKSSVDGHPNDRRSNSERPSLSPVPRHDTRQDSDLHAPIVFTRDAASVTGLATKLSTSLSQTGVQNLDRGPTVLFQDITYSVLDPKSPTGTKHVLRQVSGQFDWGKLSMVMGATGSGKSSLIHILAGNNGAPGQISGNVYYNGEFPDVKKPMWERCALVPEHDEVLRDLTVRETLVFAMKLRVLGLKGLKVVDDNVKATMENVHLDGVADTRVKKLAPGERKRLSIAEEMVHGPKLLLIDEPITGVSMFEASKLLSIFREMVNQDRTIVASIQQPSSEIFHLFDYLLLLSAGRVIYAGRGSKVTTYFVQGPHLFCTTAIPNPADFLVSISAGLLADHKGDFIGAEELELEYRDTDSYRRLEARFPSAMQSTAVTGVANPLIRNGADDDDAPPPCSAPGSGSEKSADRLESGGGAVIDRQGLDTASETEVDSSIMHQRHRMRKSTALQCLLYLTECKNYVLRLRTPTWDEVQLNAFKTYVLFCRAWLSLLNRYELVVGSLVFQAIVGVTFGLFMNDASSIPGVGSFLSFCGVGAVSMTLLCLQYNFFLFNNNRVFLREHSRELYPIWASWLVGAIPVYVLNSASNLVLVSIVVGMTNLDTDPNYYYFMVFSWMAFVTATLSFIESIIYLAHDVQKSFIGIVGFAFINFVFSGIFVKSGNLPEWLNWIPNLFAIRWNMQAQYVSYYEDQVGVGKLFVPFPSGYSLYQTYMDLFGWGYNRTRWFCFRNLIIIFLVGRVVCYLTLCWMSFQKRRGAVAPPAPEDFTF